MSNLELKITFLLTAVSLAVGIITAVFGYLLQKVDDCKTHRQQLIIGGTAVAIAGGLFLLIFAFVSFASFTDYMPDSQSTLSFNFSHKLVCTSPYNCTDYISNTPPISCPNVTYPQQMEGSVSIVL